MAASPRSLYGSVKMWAHLQREGITVARCTAERLMRINGWQGVRRMKKVRTTVADPAHDRAPDLVKRQFRAPAPNRLLVADFTSWEGREVPDASKGGWQGSLRFHRPGSEWCRAAGG